MTAAAPQKSIAKSQYQVTDVQKIDAPEGMEGKNWHSYTIERGTCVITGQKPGTLKAVTAHAKQVAADLNARTGVNAGSLYAARRKA
jgi:hypothetical protein